MPTESTFLRERVVRCAVGRLGLQRSLVVLTADDESQIGGLRVRETTFPGVSPEVVLSAYQAGVAEAEARGHSPDSFAMALPAGEDLVLLLLPAADARSSAERDMGRAAFGLPERRVSGGDR
jgi:hypothetical protein